MNTQTHKHTHSNSQIFLGYDLEGNQQWKNKHPLEVGCGGDYEAGMERVEEMGER